MKDELDWNIYDSEVSFRSRWKQRLRPARGHSNARGVSLVEVVIILAMSMVVTAVAVPKISQAMKTYNLSAAATSFSGAIQTARYQAIMRGYHYRLAFDQTTRTSQLSSKVPPATMFSNVGGLNYWSTASYVTMSPTKTLEFFPGGTVYDSANTTNLLDITFTMTNGTITKTITVSGVGNVKIQ